MNETRRSKSERDWWDKASILSQFLSSVVIAVIGIAITVSVQRSQIASSEAMAEAQLEIEKLRLADERRIEEGQLTAQLLRHLASKDQLERAIAISTLKNSVLIERFDAVLVALAKNDPSQEVREAAIQRLGESGDVQLAPILVRIARDSQRSNRERELAGVAVHKIEVSADLPPGTLALAAGVGTQVLESGDLRHGVFSHFVIEALKGNADTDRDGEVTASELSAFVLRQVPEFTRSAAYIEQRPVASLSGEDFSVTGASMVGGVLIGISDYPEDDVPSLRYAEADAKDLYSTFASLSRAQPENLILLLNSAATRSAILQALKELAGTLPEDALLLFYFSGYGMLDETERSCWIVAGETDGTESRLSLSEVKAIVGTARARSKLIVMDASFSGASFANAK